MHPLYIDGFGASMHRENAFSLGEFYNSRRMRCTEHELMFHRNVSSTWVKHEGNMSETWGTLDHLCGHDPDETWPQHGPGKCAKTWVNETWVMFHYGTWVVFQYGTWVMFQYGTWVVLQHRTCFIFQYRTRDMIHLHNTSHVSFTEHEHAEHIRKRVSGFF